MSTPMYETQTTRQDGLETTTVLLGRHVIARVSEHTHPRLPRPHTFVAEGLAFEGTSPAYQTPTPAVVWAIRAHQNGGDS